MRRRALPVTVLVAAVVAACGPGAGSTAPSITAGPSAAAAPTGRTSPSAAGGPPAAYLHGVGSGDAGAAGAEGSYTWDGFGSDAPWVVHPSPSARGAGPWSVAVHPPLPVERWSARWAPVVRGAAGDAASGTEGAGSAIVVEAPATPGRWSLQVDASFGVGRRAAWYWTVEVLP